VMVSRVKRQKHTTDEEIWKRISIRFANEFGAQSVRVIMVAF